MIPLDEALELIREAQRMGLIHKTPLLYSESLSRVVGGRAYIKAECLQKTGSFKVRGAYVAVTKLLGKGVRHVVTASSGNHAQGVAYACQVNKVRATIVMPSTAPWIKVKKVRDYGAEVVLYGDTYHEAYQYSLKLAEELGAAYVHAYDDPYVIAGQGTIGVEILEELDDFDTVVVPVGGGGLISGIAYAVKRVRPNVRVIGVQSTGSPSAYRSLKEGRIVEVESIDTIADGIAVKRIGELTFKLMVELVDDIVLVDDNEIVDAIYFLLERSRIVAEGAGAASVAAVLSGKVKGSKIVAVCSGGNIDPTLLMRVLIKAMAREGRIVRVRGELPDRPGMLYRALEVIARNKVNIVEVFHERYDPVQKPHYAYVTLILEVPPETNVLDKVISELRSRGFYFELVG